MVRSVMDELVRNSFMDEWCEHEEGARLTLHDHREMEQGALIIEWSRKRADLDLRGVETRSQTLEAILDIWVRHHRGMYVRVGSHDTPSVVEAGGR